MKLFRLGLLRDTYHRPSSGRFGGLLEKDVGVGPPEPESADSGPAWMIGRGLPRFGFGEHTKRTAIQIDLVSRLFEVGGGRKNLVLHGQHRLEEAHRSGSSEQMARIRFGRPDHTLARFVLSLCPKCLETRELDGIPDRCARRVTLDHIHLTRRPSRGLIGSLHGAELAFSTGGEEAALHIVGEPNGVYDGTDPIAVLPCIRQTLQYEYTGSFAHD
jgi:hypothetical protein|tara:strand:- start:296 stop:943 length:648 start_codon:yes stop_codon:yes gene_type:complete